VVYHKKESFNSPLIRVAQAVCVSFWKASTSLMQHPAKPDALHIKFKCRGRSATCPTNYQAGGVI